jgi:uncharacterized membrane protein
VKETVAPIAASPTGGRLASIDVLRGLIMVLMVLDHTRDYFMDLRVDPTNLAKTTIPLFFTRWVTHFCAPMFIFLAGASAYLIKASGKQQSPGALARFLASRGLFLVVLEVTLIRLCFFFNYDPKLQFLLVFWSIGMSMILLGTLVAWRFPARWIGALGALIVFGHNLLDLPGTTPSPDALSPGQLALVTIFLRRGVLSPAPGFTWIVGYPILPWFGIMALGYAFGEVLVKDRRSRIRITASLGIAATTAWVLLRAWGVYGDPVPFRPQETTVKTVLAFLNCLKYPPSLLFVLMTLGPGLLLLALLDATEPKSDGIRQASAPRRWLMTLGRVPLFYYVLQWPVIHLLANVVGELSGQRVPWFDAPMAYPAGYGYSLAFVYLMWGVVLAILYFPCRWYAGLKQRRKDLTWLSYV